VEPLSVTGKAADAQGTDALGHDCEGHWGPRQPSVVDGAEAVVRRCALCGRAEAVWVRRERPRRARREDALAGW
jgi:hypothetical protein